MTDLDLGDIQGNVLAGYGMGHAAYLTARIDDASAGRRLLRDLRPEVTHALRWDGKPPSTLNVALSYAGLQALGVPDAVLATFPYEFRVGMAARAQALADTGESAPQHWEPALRAIQLLVLVHARTPEALEDRLRKLRGLGLAELQRAAVLLPDDIHGREHFGFSDGFSQPSIAGAPAGTDAPGQGVPTRLGVRRVGPLPLPRRPGWRPLAAGEFILGYRDEDGVIPQAPAAPLGRNGTFMVYRKLEQDVVGFRILLRDLANEHWGPGAHELAAAKIVGRWRDGTPLMLSPEGPDRRISADKQRANDFLYAADPRGFRCPVGAHIRRANPRDALAGGAGRTRRRRIVRRGMPYGPPLDPASLERDGLERGLIFICFNASLTRQFETVNGWCMDGDVFGLGGDRDYLLGAGEDGEDAKMTVQGDPPVLLTPQPPLVTTRGGEYLFQPGLTALDALGTP